MDVSNQLIVLSMPICIFGRAMSVRVVNLSEGRQLEAASQKVLDNIRLFENIATDISSFLLTCPLFKWKAQT